MPTGNLFADATPSPEGERFETLLIHRNLVVERIVSSAAVVQSEYVQPRRMGDAGPGRGGPERSRRDPDAHIRGLSVPAGRPATQRAAHFRGGALAGRAFVWSEGVAMTVRQGDRHGPSRRAGSP